MNASKPIEVTEQDKEDAQWWWDQEVYWSELEAALEDNDEGPLLASVALLCAKVRSRSGA